MSKLKFVRAESCGSSAFGREDVEEAMHVYTRDKEALRQSVMYPGERKSVWELAQALGGLKLQPRHPILLALWRHAVRKGFGRRGWSAEGGLLC